MYIYISQGSLLCWVHVIMLGSSWDFSTASYLILPWDGDTASGKLGVEIIVCLVQVDTLNGGELLNVQNIFTVDRPGL